MGPASRRGALPRWRVPVRAPRLAHFHVNDVPAALLRGAPLRHHVHDPEWRYIAGRAEGTNQPFSDPAWDRLRPIRPATAVFHRLLLKRFRRGGRRG